MTDNGADGWIPGFVSHSHRRAMPPAYPTRVYRDRLRRWRALGCWTLFLAAIGSGYVYAVWSGIGGVLTIVGITLVLTLLYIIARLAIQSCDVRIVPHYDRKHIGADTYHPYGIGADTYLYGHALARNCRRLDRIASVAGVRSLSAFGFSDPTRGERRILYEAEEGLRTFRALLEAVERSPELVDDAREVAADLRRVIEALIGARAQGVRFGLLVREGRVDVPSRWQERGS